MKLILKLTPGAVALVGIFLYLFFIDVYEYPPEQMKSGKGIITQSDYYLMSLADSFVLDGKKVNQKSFSDATPHTVYLNGKVHLQGAFFAWVYYIWELVLFTLLFMLWYIYEQGKNTKYIPLFCATVWMIRAVWQILLLCNLVKVHNLNNICKSASVIMLWLAFLSLVIAKIKHEYYKDLNNKN